MKRDCNQKSLELLALHKNGKLLILPNVWDVIGARIQESEAYPAVATASAAISSSLGYQDGEMIRRRTLYDILERIAKSVSVPVTADIERGYGESISELKESVDELLGTGVVGINIEDSLEEDCLRPIKEQCERISAVREMAEARGIHLVINARIDSFLLQHNDSLSDRIETAVTRAELYADAGADCIYPIGPSDESTIKLLRDRIAAPINFLASANAISLKELQSIGVNRVSFGPFIFRSCLHKFLKISQKLKQLGSYDCFSNDTISYDRMHDYLQSGAER